MTSPSEITTFRKCIRLWWYRYALGIKTAPTIGQATGTNVHKVIEDYLVEGKVPDDPSLAIYIGVAAPFLPYPPYPRELVEHKFQLGEMRAVIDLVEDHRPEWVRVTDYKTTSQIGKYAKTAEELKADPQAIIYCAYAEWKWPGAKEYRFRHLNLQTKAPRRAHPEEIIWAPGEALHEYQTNLEPLERAMVVLRPLRDITSIPADGCRKGECGRYGGCHFQKPCIASGVPVLGRPGYPFGDRA